MEFTKPAYNIHEHNHVEWSDARLKQRDEELQAINKPWQSPEGLARVQGEIGKIAFEVSKRKDDIQDEIDKAWSEYERA